MATFGFTSKGSFEFTGAANYLHAARFYCGSAGTATSLTIYLKYSGYSNIKLAIYTDDNGYPGTLVGYTEPWLVTSGYNNWKTLNIISGGNLTPGYYWLVWWQQYIGNKFYYSIDVTDGYKYVFVYQAYGDTFPNTFPAGGTNYNNEKCSIYCTYTPSIVRPKQILGDGLGLVVA